MCQFCDGPEESFEDYYRRLIRPIIDEHGWFIQYVEAGGSFPSYAYTVGLTEHGFAELIVTGLTPKDSAQLLNAGGEAAHCRRLQHGDRLTIAGRRVEVVVLPHPEAHLLFADDVYGPQLVASQLVYADLAGIWPWSRGHRAGAGGQPVLGPRSALRVRRRTP